LPQRGNAVRDYLPGKKGESLSHGDAEGTERSLEATDVLGTAKSRLRQTPFEYEYEYRCAEYEYEYEKVRDSTLALLPPLLRASVPP
jgi:hypothetical protein